MPSIRLHIWDIIGPRRASIDGETPKGEARKIKIFSEKKKKKCRAVLCCAVCVYKTPRRHLDGPFPLAPPRLMTTLAGACFGWRRWSPFSGFHPGFDFLSWKRHHPCRLDFNFLLLFSHALACVNPPTPNKPTEPAPALGIPAFVRGLRSS